ncbi:hypothetical protein TMatcc_011291 [Talaromyces marneffei ATCC 18224]
MSFSRNRPPPIVIQNLAQFRTQLFVLESPIHMPTAEFEILWKYVDNIYLIALQKQGVDYGEKRPTKTPPLKSVEENDLVELHIGCPCKIKIIESAVAKGYKPSEVNKTLRNAKNGNLEALEIAWGANFSAKAVHNATQSWVRSHGSMAEERIPKSTSPKASDDRIGPTRRELETKDMPEELRDTILQNWIASLRTQTDFLRLVGENRSKPGDTKRLTKQIGAEL